jgi:FMN-dependent NADH-azoreductase
MNVLSIQSSAGMDRSLTRQLSHSFLNLLSKEANNLSINHLDLVKDNPPFMTPDWIAGAFSKSEPTPEQKQALQKSDNYISQVAAADLLVLGAPMYNYGMPAVLKAWFDQVARINKTFSFDLSRGDQPIEPILSGKQLVLFTSSGEFGFNNGSREEKNHLVPHLKSCIHYLGVDPLNDFHHVGIEYQEFKDSRYEASKQKAFELLPLLAKRILRRE